METETIEQLKTIMDLIRAIPKSDIDSGLMLMGTVRSHFRFTGTTWTREDADNRVGRDLADEEWEAMYETPWWGSLNVKSETDYYCIDEAIKESKIPYELNI